MECPHQDIKSRVTEFFLSGPPELDIHSVHITANELIDEIKQSNDKTKLVNELTNIHNRSETLLNDLEKKNIMNEFRKYSKFILQEQLLVMAKCIDELKKNNNMSEYPDIVQDILKKSPQVIPQTSNIYNFLKVSVEDIRQQLLNGFHKRFESHLVKSEELTSSMNMTNDDDVSWEKFLSQARPTIVAYMMVRGHVSYVIKALMF